MRGDLPQHKRDEIEASRKARLVAEGRVSPSHNARGDASTGQTRVVVERDTGRRVCAVAPCDTWKLAYLDPAKYSVVGV